MLERKGIFVCLCFTSNDKLTYYIEKAPPVPPSGLPPPACKTSTIPVRHASKIDLENQHVQEAVLFEDFNDPANTGSIRCAEGC